MNWWDAPEYDRNPMKFPDRQASKQAVIVVPVKKAPGANDQKPDERVRVYVGR